MTAIRFIGMSAAEASGLRNRKPDIYGNNAEAAVSSGRGTPCRVCLKQIEKGASYLLAAYRPFSKLHAYAETGPIFLHEDHCDAQSTRSLPDVLPSLAYIVRGYDHDERIAGGTGGVIARDEIVSRATSLLSDPSISFVDIRATDNNCWLTRAVRDGEEEL